MAVGSQESQIYARVPLPHDHRAKQAYYGVTNFRAAGAEKAGTFQLSQTQGRPENIPC